MSHQNSPMKISTGNQKRNLIITVIVASLLLLGAGIYLIFGLNILGTPSKNILSNNKTVIETTDIADINNSDRTLDSAKENISTYYSLLGAFDASTLRAKGFTVAANAIDQKWMKAIEYSVLEKVVSPDVNEMPSSVGTYAGNTLYAISDFFSVPSINVTKSLVTGTLGYVGWIYYDTFAAQWVIIDPTIPTGTQAAEAGHVSKTSTDKAVTVSMSSPGAFSNPWWSYTMVSVDITSAAKDYGVTVKSRSFDGGLTVGVPDGLLVGLSPAAASSANSENISSIVPVKVSGICVVYRGVLNNFSIDRIGQVPLRIDGDICPINIDTPSENITPVFVIGTGSSSDIQKLLNEDEIARYGATNESVDILPEIASNAANNTSNTNSAFENTSNLPLNDNNNIGGN